MVKLGTPDLSIVIPSRNRATSLNRLLSSLKKSNNEIGINFEILVVNNASSDHTMEILNQQKYEMPFLNILYERKPGKNIALNKGLSESRGRYLCLMDDDIVMDPLWLESLIKDYRITSFDALQPRVLPGRDPDGNFVEGHNLYKCNIPVIDHGLHFRDIKGLTGVIMSFKRHVFEKVGGFDERLPTLGYEGDTHLSARIRLAGFKIGYTPHVIAYHELDPSRYGISYARNSQFRKGLSRSLYASDSIIINVLPNIILSIFRYFIYKIYRKDEKLYKTEKRIIKYWGYLVGRMRICLGKDPWIQVSKNG